MVRSILRLALPMWVAVGALGASVAHAQDVDEDSDDKGAEKKSDDKEADSEKAKPEKSEKESPAADSGSSANSPVEEQGKTYRFLGARYRAIVVPQFMLNLFADGGRTVVVHSFGPEFAIRKDGFEYNLGAWLAFYSMDDTAFKGKSDPTEAWELISSSIKILYLTSDFMWTHQFSPEWGLNYGVGAGLGIVFGDLHRNQTYPASGDPNQDPNTWTKCTDVGIPPNAISPGHPYCDNSNNHYGDYTEASWLGGGSKPVLFPWLTIQTGLRFKPSHSFAGRLDLGFGTSGFFFGLGGDYGLPD